MSAMPPKATIQGRRPTAARGSWSQRTSSFHSAVSLEITAADRFEQAARCDPRRRSDAGLEERQNVPPLQLSACDHLPLRINAVDLEHRFGDIETDCRNRLHDWLLQIVGGLNSTHIHGTHVPVEEVAVGTEISLRPPHRSRRALLTHRAPTLDGDEETAPLVKTASRMRTCACDTATRLCVRTVLCSSAFSLAPTLRSTGSATAATALFVRFIATMSRSDFSITPIVGYGLRPSRRGPGHDWWGLRWRSPGSRTKGFCACQGLRRRGAGSCLRNVSM